MRNAVIIDDADNVVVAIEPLEAATLVTYVARAGETHEIVTTQPIPLYHKIARVPIPQGGKVIKYGEYIGLATQDIHPGDHVHVHNCVSTDRLREEVEDGQKL
ncbi:MAG: hydrolase [Coriobacteriaceae bacterium]|nr:hydrolase [Coriobacteriaceae bacterium]